MLEFICTQLIDIVAIALRYTEHIWNTFLVWTLPVRDHEVYIVPIFWSHGSDYSCSIKCMEDEGIRLVHKDVADLMKPKATDYSRKSKREVEMKDAPRISSSTTITIIPTHEPVEMQ
jgi:hypothetical protein